MFAGTVTDAGTVTEVEFDESVTTTPPVGAELPIVTVQFTELFGNRDAPHCTDEMLITTTCTVALADEPLRVAVTVAAWFELTVAALMLNDAEVALAATVTDAGTVSPVTLLLSATLDPPEGAALLSITVHEAAPPCARLAAVH